MNKVRNIIIVIIILLLSYYYVFYYSNNNIKVIYENIKSKEIAKNFDGFSIFNITDLYLENKNYETKIDQIVEKSNSNGVDLLILSGEIISDWKESNKIETKKIIEKINQIDSSYGRFYAKSKDQKLTKDEKYILNKTNFTIMDHDQRYKIYYKDANKYINLFGTNKDYFETYQDGYNILVSNNPDIKTQNIDLILSGQNLNGGLNIPFYDYTNFDKYLTKKYRHGLYKEKDRTLLVSGGVGLRKFNFRIFNTPEIQNIIITK